MDSRSRMLFMSAPLPGLFHPRLTAAGREYMRQAMLDGGELIKGGPDETQIGPDSRPPRQNVLNRLYISGWIMAPTGMTDDRYRVTQKAWDWWKAKQ